MGGFGMGAGARIGRRRGVTQKLATRLAALVGALIALSLGVCAGVTYALLAGTPHAAVASELVPIVGAGAGLTVVVGVVLAILFARWVAWPIEAIVAAMRELAFGDMEQRVVISRGDEIGDLARGFNQMAYQIEEYTRELERARSAAEQAAVAKGDFLSSMSHELRTPMNGVLGFTELLLDTELDTEQREFAEIAYSSGTHLLAIINDILDFSKAEAGQLTLERISFDLYGVVQGVGQLLNPQVEQKGIELIVRYAPDLPPRFMGDPVRVRQVLTNLVGNAVKFTSEGHVLISVGVDPDDPLRLLFSVEDTGVGIPPERLASIFEKFEQGDASTTREYGGTGLGLAISRHILEMMGAKLHVSSVRGRGSRFYFSAPLEADLSQPEPYATDEQMRSVPVLIVDDNAVNRRVLEELLSNWGVRTTSCASAEEALQAIREAAAEGEPFPIGLLDLCMPNVDGEGLARAIVADPDIPEMQLVLLTSAVRTGDLARFDDAGFAAYLPKPVRQVQLREALSLLVGRLAEREIRPMITAHSLPRPVPARSPVVDGEGLAVLVAEDDRVNQKVAKRLLTRLGCRVEIAKDGREAVEMYGATEYALVFMDCQMPELDGYGATGEIRALEQERGTHVPIVAMTAHAMHGDKERCLAAGMDDYITKPVSKEILADVLMRWAERKS